MHGREVGVAGVAVADQDPGELRQHPRRRCRRRCGSPDMHRDQILGAGETSGHTKDGSQGALSALPAGGGVAAVATAATVPSCAGDQFYLER